MKFFLLLICASISFCHFAQKPFQHEKKWGLSKTGEGPDAEGDSIIFRADFDEIQSIPCSNGKAFAGLKGEEWVLLTSNRLVHQQRYEKFVPYKRMNRFCYAMRDGYLDIIDLEANDYLIRNVQADALVEDHALKVDELIVIKKGKEELLGLININAKKVILKAEYASIIGNAENIQHAKSVIAFKANENLVYDYQGNLLFKLGTDQAVSKVADLKEIDRCYKIHAANKKGETVGFFDSQNKWFVPPIYKQIMFLENLPEIVIVQGDKGLGLYFQGKMILPCEYLEITKSDKQGLIAIVTTKKGDFYVADDGKLTPRVVED